jgi:tripeptidyl-peptidase-1
LKFLTLLQVKDIVGVETNLANSVSDWFHQIGADSVEISAIGDTVTARFQPGHEFESSSRFPTHNFTFDFLIRRDTKRSKQTKKSASKSIFTGGTYSVSNQKQAYGIPETLAATNESTLQMVWGPGTFGFSLSQLEDLRDSDVPLLNVSRVTFDTKNHGQAGGDNYGEGNLDTQMISSFGLNVHTIVSNTNTSASTEEGNGFGYALLDFLTQLSSRDQLPQVLSISLGSLGGYACNLLCEKAVEKGVSTSDCNQFLQQQRQVCMYLSTSQVDRISAALKILGTRGVTVFGSSGDGGSHFSFGPFEGGKIASVLNEVSCEFSMPVFPTTSPYVVSVGGTDWSGFFNPNPKKPKAWSGTGGGFSWQFPAPPHQTATVDMYLSSHSNTSEFPVPASFNAAGRAYPDISAVAVDGTSQSSPTMAGIFSLLMDHRLNSNLPPLGFVAPRLWQVNQKYPGEAFESVPTGNTKTTCATGFPSDENSWDPVTGWGRPVWAGIVKHFGSDDML